MSAGIPLDVATGPPQRRARTLAAELLRHWRIGQRPSVESFAAEWDVRAPHELAAIARTDLRERWRRGERPQACDYLDRFPQLRDDADLVVDLLYAEFLAHEELGEEPELHGFEASFPDHVAALLVQVEFHRALRLHELPAADTQRDDEGSAVTLATGVPGARRLPDLSPHYEVIAEIGRGGMGVVFRANKVSLNRLVALKMVRAAEHANPELLARFRAEAEAVARLHHPQIVQIFDYGEHNGAPYLALELVEGTTLAAALDGKPWPAPQAAQLVETLARAVHFAHQQGVIHRDLKPANVLVAGQGPGTRDQGPGAQTGSWLLAPGSLKIADFGLAKVFGEGQPSNTETGAILGTPSYMAPEQAVGRSEQVGPATDVYALGAILYELLTGRPPFQAASTLETLQQVVSEEPVPPRRLQPRLPADLATICSKCLSKEPRQRYASAEELADDLARFLADRPIQARPTTTLERGWRWCRRNPVVAVLTGSVAALLLTVSVVSSVLSVRLNSQLQKTGQAESAERSAKQASQLRLFEAYLAEAKAKYSSRQIGQRFGTLETVDQANAVLDEVGRTPDRILRLRNATIAALALPDLRRVRTIKEPPVGGASLAFSAAADRYVVSTLQGDLIVYRLSDERQLKRLSHPESASPSISSDGRYVGASGRSGLKVWRIDTEPPEIVWEELGASKLTFLSDGRQAAYSGADQRMHLLDLETGHRARQLGRGAARSLFDFHAPSQRIAVCGAESVQIFDTKTGEVECELPPPTMFLPNVAWHPSGNYLAVTGYGDGVALWDVASKRRLKTYAHVSDTVHCHFAGDGEQLLTHDMWIGRLHLWHTATGRELLSDVTFGAFVSNVTPAGQVLLLAMEGRIPALWEVEAGAQVVALPNGLSPSLGYPRSIAVSPEGSVLAIGRDDGFELWNLPARRRLASFAIDRHCVTQFAADGALITNCDSGVMRWPRQMVTSVEKPAHRSDLPVDWRFGPPEKLCGPLSEPKFVMTPNAERLAVQAGDVWRIIRPGVPGQVRCGPQGDPRCVSLSADGRWLAVGSWNNSGARVYDADSGTQLVDLPVDSCVDLLFSPDGRWLATSPGGVELWHTSDWRPGPKLHARGNKPSGLAFAFSPDSLVLAVGQPSGETRFVDPATGTDLATLVHPDRAGGPIVTFSPDQTRLIIQAPGADSATTVWDLAAIRRELARRRLDWPAEVLKTQPATHPLSRDKGPLSVVLDGGKLVRQQQALKLMRQAGSAKTAAARDLLLETIELDPENGLAHNNLAWLLAAGPIELRNPKQALECARRAVALESERHSYLNTLGVALYRADQHQEAAEVLNRSLAISPPREAAFDLLFLALCQAQRGEWPAANESYLRAVKLRDEFRQQWGFEMQAEWDRLFGEAQAAGLPH